jgi:vacuolar iron transporter family protein
VLINQPKQPVSTRDDALMYHAIVGIADGLTIPFALAVGLSQVTNSTQLILVAGFAATLAGAFTMGIGGSSAQRTAFLEQQQDAHDDSDHSNTKKINKRVAQLGLHADTADQLTTELIADKKQLESIIGVQETGSPFDAARSFSTGIIISVFYIVGGLIPLAPYLLAGNLQTALKLSVVITLVCLSISGILKSKYSGQKPFESAVRLAITGALAGFAAFAVATIFKP